ncbi:MAG: ATP-binding cassette domain-containing protein [Ruminococcaceae bacterium]|nr:ATP-binding cassette domain-containing protein [Oscillospiraceae bacterium]
MPKNVLLAPPENVMVRCENLVKIYKTDEVEVMALQGLDLTVERGELMGIVGSSGSGKSTLLNMLGGLDKPSAGTLFVDGKDLLKFGDKELISYMRDTVGFVWQNNARNLIPYLTAVQNVELPMLLKGVKNRREHAERLLETVGLSARKNSMLGQMSGGEQQRVAIAIALANNPRLLLADEPTGAVDTKTAAMVLDVFKRLNRELGVTIIIVTHDVNLSKSIDRVVSIRDGKTATEMIRKESLSHIASFGELSEAQKAEINAEGAREELAVLDRVGRLQLPKEYLSALGIKGGDKVRVELEEDAILIKARDGTHKKKSDDTDGESVD